MAAKDVKQFLLTIQFKTQGKITGDATAKQGPLDMTTGLQCHAFEYLVESQFDAGSGMLTGRRKHSALRIVREVDSASPLLWQALCTNENLVAATLSFARPDGTGKLALHTTIALTGGAIVKYRTWHGILPGSGDELEQLHTNELEEFDLVFQKLTYSNTIKSKSAQDDWNAMT
ncbi:MAG: type VI secretion system tube protein TssD [Polyangiaceae bacterium]|jgi:type VI secretion system secreted protein Hcp